MTAASHPDVARFSLTGLIEPEVAACDSCLDRLTVRLRTLDGVSSADVESGGALALAYDPALTTPLVLEDAVRAEGHQLAATFTHEVWPVEGMDCADCARNIERGVARLSGVHNAEVNFAGARLAVEYAADTTTPETIAKTVASMGYRLGHDSAVAATDGHPLVRLLADRENLPMLAGMLLVIAGISFSAVGLA